MSDEQPEPMPHSLIVILADIVEYRLRNDDARRRASEKAKKDDDE